MLAEMPKCKLRERAQFFISLTKRHEARTLDSRLLLRCLKPRLRCGSDLLGLHKCLTDGLEVLGVTGPGF
jgi:hypothetical protein